MSDGEWEVTEHCHNVNRSREKFSWTIFRDSRKTPPESGTAGRTVNELPTVLTKLNRVIEILYDNGSSSCNFTIWNMLRNYFAACQLSLRNFGEMKLRRTLSQPAGRFGVMTERRNTIRTAFDNISRSALRNMYTGLIMYLGINSKLQCYIVVGPRSFRRRSVHHDNYNNDDTKSPRPE